MTAIIVNSRGEVFTHWASGCSISASGFETYHSVAVFQKTRVEIRDANGFWPAWRSKRRHRTIGKPYVFSSVRAAEQAMKRIGFTLGGSLAVVS